MDEKCKSSLITINEVVENYLPISKRNARKFVALYLEPKVIGNRIYVEREKLENLLKDTGRNKFPLNF